MQIKETKTVSQIAQNCYKELQALKLILISCLTFDLHIHIVSQRVAVFMCVCAWSNWELSLSLSNS